MILQGLEPVGSPAARILILGSFPSRQSLERKEYYANPRNHFWTVLGAVLGAAFPDDYPGRIDALRARRILVWDVARDCERPGSLDADIRAARPNPVPDLLAAHPTIERIALNGSAAGALFLRFFAPELIALPIGTSREWTPRSESSSGRVPAGRTLLVARLPSTSPIPTRDYRTAEDKTGIWRDFLESGRKPG